MNSYFAKELGQQYAETGVAFLDRLRSFPPADQQQIITAAELFIRGQAGRHYSMAPGHVWERANIQFAG